MSGREARAELERCGVAPWRARRAVELGLAGDPVVTRGAFLYDADTVRALGGRRAVPVDELRAAAPHGYVVAQLNVHAGASREELDAVGHDARGWVLQDPRPWSATAAGGQLPTGKGRGWTAQEPWKWRAYPQSTSSAARRLS